jgi:sulfate transport system permease protein
MLAERIEPLTDPEPWEGEEFVPDPILQPIPQVRRAQTDPFLVRWCLTGFAVLTVGLLVIVPVVHVFYQAFGAGVSGYVHSLFGDPDTRHSIFLTLVIAPVAVALNVVFGIAAAWVIARFRFPGRLLLTTLIDLPFSVSPVVAGLVFVLLFGLKGSFGSWLRDHGYQVLFAPPGLLLVTAFVTIPFVARELIPVLEAIGPEEDLAALSLGATGWQMFWRVTLPNMRWGLIYGVVYVVSGHITGQTDTMPLRVEKLFQEYNSPAAFAVASVLTVLALVTLALKVVVQRRSRQAIAAHPEKPRGDA